MISSKSLRGKILSIAAFVLVASATFLPNNVFAVSLYTSSVSTATVGTAITPTLQYTYSPQQTWADADTLTFVLPANFPTWSAVTYTVEYDADSTHNGSGETAITEGVGNGQYAVSSRTITVEYNRTGWGAPSPASSAIRIIVTAGLTPQYADAAAVVTFGGSTVAAGDTNPSGTAAIVVSAAAAAPILSLSTNNTVGVAGNSTLQITAPIDLPVGSKIIFTAPSNLTVSSIAFVSHTFGGAGTLSCAAASQIVTCTSAGATIPLGIGGITLSGISTSYAASSQTLSSISITDGTNTLATASTGATSNTFGAAMGASLTLSGNSVVGGTGNSTLSYTTTFMPAGGKVVFTAPYNLDVSGVAFVSHTFGGAAVFTCVAVSHTVTCTSSGASITSGAGSMVLSGIAAAVADTGKVMTAVTIQDASSNVRALSSTGNAVTDTSAAEMSASLVLSTNSAVGVSGNSTLTFTVPITIAADTTVVFTAPTNLNVSGVTYVSHSFGGSATFSCAASGQTVTCTVVTAPISAGTGTLVLSGISAVSSGTGKVLTNAAVKSATDAYIAMSSLGNTVTDTTGGSSSGSASLSNIVYPSNPKLVLNHGAQTTNSLTVDAEVSATNATQIAISNRADFQNAVWQPIQSTMKVALQNTNGPQMVYVKFASGQGVESSVVSASVVYVPASNASPVVVVTPVQTPVVTVAPAVGKFDVDGAKKATPSIAHDFNLPSPTTTRAGSSIRAPKSARPAPLGYRTTLRPAAASSSRACRSACRPSLRRWAR